MPNRSWFYAANGQQQGPFPEEQLRDLIARGAVRADTLVWSEGMAGWQKVAEIPGLMSMPPGPPAMPRAGGPPVYTGGPVVAARSRSTFRSGISSGAALLTSSGIILVIPAPWVGACFYRWLVSRLHVPGRPNLAFTGQVGDQLVRVRRSSA